MIATLPLWLQAGLWGWLAGFALLIGAGLGYYLRIPPRMIAAVMAFGSGVLISALSFELMEEAFQHGGSNATALGFVSGAGVYTLANWLLAHHGAKHRKRSGYSATKPSPHSQDAPRQTATNANAGAAIAIGALIDGIPESIVIGLSMLGGGKVSMVAVAAIFLSNIPEGMSSATGMKTAGRSKMYIFGIWAMIALMSGMAAIIGLTGFPAR